MLIRMGKLKYIWATVIPLCFMIATALTAAFYNIFEFYLPKNQLLLAGSSAIMMLLIIFIIFSSIKKWSSLIKDKNNAKISV